MPISPRLDAGEFIVDDDDDDQFETQVRSAVARETAGRRQLSQPAWSGTDYFSSREEAARELLQGHPLGPPVPQQLLASSDFVVRLSSVELSSLPRELRDGAGAATTELRLQLVIMGKPAQPVSLPRPFDQPFIFYPPVEIQCPPAQEPAPAKPVAFVLSAPSAGGGSRVLGIASVELSTVVENMHERRLPITKPGPSGDGRVVGEVVCSITSLVSPLVGERVVAEANGVPVRSGVAVSYDHVRGRYAVELDHEGGLLSVRPRDLRAVNGGLAVPARAGSFAGVGASPARSDGYALRRPMSAGGARPAPALTRPVARPASAAPTRVGGAAMRPASAATSRPFSASSCRSYPSSLQSGSSLPRHAAVNPRATDSFGNPVCSYACSMYHGSTAQALRAMSRSTPSGFQYSAIPDECFPSAPPTSRGNPGSSAAHTAYESSLREPINSHLIAEGFWSYWRQRRLPEGRPLPGEVVVMVEMRHGAGGMTTKHAAENYYKYYER